MNSAWQKLQRRSGRGWVAVMGLMLGLSLASYGQGSTSTFTGVITDTSGAVIPGAHVVIINASTGAKRTTTSDAHGGYRVPYLQVARYSISVSANGFSRMTRNNIVLTVGQTAQVNLELKPGSIAQSVTVNGMPPLLESQTSEIGQVISPAVVKYAPLDANNFTQLAILSPGVVRGQAGSPLAGGGGLIGAGGPPQVGTEGFRFQTSGGSDLAISGLRPDQNNFILDGVDNNEAVYSQVGIFPPPDSIREFRIITATPPAEYGHAAGGVIEVITKSGTNQFHGSLYDYLRNDALDARNVFDPTFVQGASGAFNKPNPKFAYRRNQWGGTLGGPIDHNKTFFFFDYTGFRNVYPSSTGLVTVPTAQARQGNFSQYGVLICNPAASTPYNATTNPTGCSPNPSLNTTGHFASDTIPSNMMDPAAKNLLNAFPLPNEPGTINNYIADRSAVSTQFHIDLRIDQNLGPDDTMMGRLTWDNLHRNTPSLFPMVPAGFGTGDELSKGRGVEIAETHIFSSNLINQFHFGYLRTGVGINEPGVYGDGGLPVNYGQQLGIPNSNPAPGAGGLPEIVAGDGLFSNGGWVGDGGTFQIPSDNYQWIDTVSYNHGRNDFKFGTSVIRRIANDQVGNTAKGVYVYYGATSWAPGTTTGNSLSDMLLGTNILPEQGWGNFGRGSLLTADQSWWELGGFGEDNFQISSHLMLNLGVRWDKYTNITEAHNRMANFNLATGGMILAGTSGLGNSLIHPDNMDFGPHVGFAYQFAHQTVLRGGYTIMYAPALPGFNGATTNLAFNPPCCAFQPGVAPANPNGWGQQYALSQGLPTYAPSTDIAHPSGNVIWENPNNKTPYVESYDLNLQKQIGSWLISVAGVGNQGHRLDALRPLSTTPYAANDPGLTGIKAWENRANSSYNALEIRANKRLSHGLLWINSYTWSHCINNSEGMVSGEGGFGSGNYPEDTNRLYLEKGNCENDIRSLYTQDFYWQLPFGRGQWLGSHWTGALNEALGGWQVDAIPYFGSGYHATPILSGGSPARPNIIGNPYAAGGGKGCPAHLGAGPSYGGSTVYFWNPCAFAPPGKGQDGNASRGSLVGPGRWNVDMSLMKHIPIQESIAASFRLSFYNVFNHPQYFIPSPSLGGGVNADQSGGFGQISSAYNQREIEAVLKLYF